MHRHQIVKRKKQWIVSFSDVRTFTAQTGAQMPIYEFTPDAITRLETTTFSSTKIRERHDLQRLLREHIDVVASEALVIAEEFGDWEDSRRRIDLLAIDKEANLVVVELKRTEDGGHMELQSVRYASMVSTMTFDQACDVFGRYLKQLGKEAEDARATMLDFLGWDEPDDELFGQDVRIVLASAEFSKELASSVLWLIDHGIDIKCVRLKPYTLSGRVLVDVQQIIPLPEAADYQFQVREKTRKEREARTSTTDFTRFDVRLGDEAHPSMWKRNAIFLICKRLCDTGAKPEEITSLFDWRPNRVWYSVDGIVDAAGFESRAAQKAASGGPKFNTKRWFCADDQLVHSDGKTYAFSNQWGSRGWHRAMQLLRQQYPQLKIAFSPEATREDIST